MTTTTNLQIDSTQKRESVVTTVDFVVDHPESVYGNVASLLDFDVELPLFRGGQGAGLLHRALHHQLTRLT